jgi:hypothetical protein
MLETGSSQIVTEARRSRRLWTPRPGEGVQNNLMCTAQLVITEAALAAPIRRLSEAVPVYAAPDQEVCGIDM